jgi:hypothetical protein
MRAVPLELLEEVRGMRAAEVCTNGFEPAPVQLNVKSHRRLA